MYQRTIAIESLHRAEQKRAEHRSSIVKLLECVENVIVIFHCAVWLALKCFRI